MRRLTTKEVGQQYERTAAFGGSVLWRAAAADVVRICSKYHRSKAIAMLERLGNRYRAMAISSTYFGAANALKQDATEHYG